MFNPVHTEKSMREAARGRFTFTIPIDLTKTEIKKWIEKAWPVQVVKVQTLITPGKSYRTGRNGRAYKPNIKKALVTLKAGQKIADYGTETV